MIRPYSIACALLLRVVANSPMSLPGENAFSPAPRTMMQRRASSAESRVIASPSACHIAFVSALSFSGRSRTTVAIGPARSTRICSVIAAPNESTIEELHEPHPGDRHVGHEQQRREQHADEPDVGPRDLPD